MSIGPVPPTSPGFNSSSGNPQFSDAAQATLCSQLAGAAPTGVSPGQGMTPAQQNTFWFLRMYGDLMMLNFIESNPQSYPPNYSQNFINDLQFIYNQASAGNTGFDPQLLQDLQNDIANPQSFSQFGTISNIMSNYNSILSGSPLPPYSASYDFTNLTPDDMYNFYLIQIGTSLFDTANDLPQNNFWPATSNTTTLLGSELGQFMCTYFVQRDGMGTNALSQDLQNFQTLMDPIISYVKTNYTDFPALNAAFQGGTDPDGTQFAGLVANLNDLTKGTWDFGSLPVGSNDTPPPWWDVTSQTQIQWNYSPDWTFLEGNDLYLAQYLASLG